MAIETTTRGSGDPLVLLLGFGNRLDGASVEWFLDGLADAGYRTTAVEFPTRALDFESAYVSPAEAVLRSTEPVAVLGFSLGGLVLAHLQVSPSIYLAPWWGFEGEESFTWERWVVPRLPIDRPVIAHGLSRTDIGPRFSRAEWSALPNRVSPRWVTAIDRAQRRRPSIDRSAPVFVSLRDQVVSLPAIGRAVAPEQVCLFDGTHAPFAAEGRETFLAELHETIEGVVE